MTKKPSLMTFPCDFQVKVIGENSPVFALEVTNIARKHFPALKNASIKSNPSKARNYLAIRLNLYVENQQSLDLLYQELTKHPKIKMVL